MDIKPFKQRELLLLGALGILSSAPLCIPSALCGDDAKKSKQKIPNDPAFAVVNKRISLGLYKPHDIVPFQGVMVSRRIIPDLKRLLSAAKADGLTLKAVSGYRSYERQIAVFNSWVTRERKKNPALTQSEAEKLVDRYSARPGHSEHQLGTTVDVLSSENGYKFTTDSRWKFISWLERNANRFNFKSLTPQIMQSTNMSHGTCGGILKIHNK